MPLILMQKENARRVTGDLFGVSAFAACTVIHQVQGLLRNKKDYSCHSSNLADTKRKFYGVAHFSLRFSLFVTVT